MIDNPIWRGLASDARDQVQSESLTMSGLLTSTLVSRNQRRGRGRIGCERDGEVSQYVSGRIGSVEVGGGIVLQDTFQVEPFLISDGLRNV